MLLNRVCTVGLFFGLLLTLSPAATAQTMSFEAAITILSTSCGKDIDKYCRDVNLGSGRLSECLSRNAASVSSQCKADYVRVFDLVQKRAQARIDVLKLCDADAQRLCGFVKQGDGQVLGCMVASGGHVSPKCNQAITDAGYR